MRRRVVEQVIQTFRTIVAPLSARFLQSKKKGLIYPEDECSTILRNIDNHSPKDTASHQRIIMSLALLILWAGIAQSVQRLVTGWTVRGSNRGGREIFRTCPYRPWGPLTFLYSWYRVFPGGKERSGHDADPSPPSSAVVMKGYSTPPVGRTACTEPQCMYKGALYLTLLFLHFPAGQDSGQRLL